jgi:FMN phosphatase YigB (HAD superfamily)
MASSKESLKFDYVLFDWKGTLSAKRPKVGSSAKSKAQRVEEALLAVGGSELVQNFKTPMATQRLDVCVRQALESIGVVDERLLNEKMTRFFDIQNPAGADGAALLCDGGALMLAKLKDRGAKMALVRNSSLPLSEFLKVIERAQCSRYFDESNVVLSGQVGAGKPDARIFEEAARRLVGDDAPLDGSAFVFIGNETAADIEGARAMGWQTVLVRTTEATSNGLATYEIDTLAELDNILFE